MKKWIIILTVIILFVAWQTIQVYISAQSNKNIGLETYVDWVKQETEFNIEHVQRYHGEQLYYVFTVVDEEDHRSYLFVNEEKQTHQISFEDVHISQDEAKDLSFKDYPELTQVIRINPAYTGKQFTWEVVAQDKQERLQYVYYSMLDGAFQKRYTLAR
jgi:uncharacterized protein YpmB